MREMFQFCATDWIIASISALCSCAPCTRRSANRVVSASRSSLATNSRASVSSASPRRSTW
jgi:hypothetical protein